jgi:hypothetical protein
MADGEREAEERRREGGPAERRRLFEAERDLPERTPADEPPEREERDAEEEATDEGS